MAIFINSSLAQTVMSVMDRSAASSDNQWTGVPKDFPVTRWPVESDIRPIRYDEWILKQEPTLPFWAKTTGQSDPVKNALQRGKFAVIVNSDLQSGIQASLDQYMDDLALDGYEVELIASSGGTPQEFRSFLYSKYLGGMQGAVLVGDFPVPWFEITCWEDYEHEEFPCDLYYMDLDGIWVDAGDDGMFDSHSGDLDPEIWIGRLTASPLYMNGADEAALINNYFLKNHLYRIGQMPLADRGLMYVDDDWSGIADYWGSDMALVYPGPMIISDPYETVADDYAFHLSDNYEMIQVCAHSDPNTHYFSTPSGSGGTLSVGAMVNIDPQAAFYNLFACSNARFVESDYMAGWYIFCPTYGLGSIGSTKTGSMLNFRAFYNPFSAGRTFGEAFSDWFAAVLYEDLPDEDICWFYGMTLCGDPTLRPGMSSCARMLGYGLTDVSGDGDYIPESGETIEGRFAFTNYGAVTATGVTISLSFNDAAITVIKESSYIGDIVPGGVGTNEGDPLIFEIPPDYNPRVDTMFITLIWNNGTCLDTIAIQLALGGARILLMDDDNHGVIDTYYRAYLTNSLTPYDVWDATDSVASASDLGNYDVVVWFTGGYRETLVNAAEVSALTGYLDGGGNLFMSGQGIAAQMSSEAPAFLSDYLRSAYQSTAYMPVLIDDPGSDVFDFVDSVCITAAGGPAYQTNADQIDTVNGSMIELNYITGIGPGAVSYAGSYRLIFFSFGFESILNGNSRWLYRDTLYADILDFFQYSFPTGIPRVLGLAVSPGDSMCLIDKTPEFSWTYFDGGGAAQDEYQIQVGCDNFWNVAEMWDGGPMSGSDTSVIYDGQPLEGGHIYYFRVRVSNGSLWSEWKQGIIRTNAVPVPTGLTPTGMQAVEETLQGLTHDNMVDPEGSPLTYSYELYDDASMTSLQDHAEDQTPQAGETTTWLFSTVLAKNEDYYWRVQARDTMEYGQWSSLAAFVVSPIYICGDANGDDQINVGDAVSIINFVFKGGASPDPFCLGDANGDDDVNIGDAVYLINYIFRSGPAPVETCCP